MRQEIMQWRAALQQEADRVSIGRQRLDRKRMNIVFQEIIDRGVDHPMPSHSGDSSKRFRHDPHAKVALAAFRAGVALVQVTLILHGELGGIEAILQAFTQTLRAAGCALTHGPGGSEGAGADGALVLFALLLSQSTCGNMKIIVAGVIPYTLKCTQVLSVKFCAT